jgi:hypothetical protein
VVAAAADYDDDGHDAVVSGGGCFCLFIIVSIGLSLC